MLAKYPFASARSVAWAVVVWLAAAAVFFRNFLLTGFDKIIGDAGDARLDIFLRENFLQFLRGQAEFLSPPMFFPVKGTLGYSDAYLLDALIYVPLRVVGIDPFLTFELLCIGLSLVGFVATNILLTRFAGVRQPLAALAATIFVFSNALYISMGHPQLYEVNIAPLVAILFLEAARSRISHPVWSITAAFFGGLVLALLFSTGYYVAWYFTFLSGIVLVSAAIVRFGLRPLGIVRARIYLALVRRNVSIGVAGALGFAIGAIPFWKIYAPIVAQFSGRGYSEYEGPFLVDLLNVSGNNIVWGGLIERLQIVPQDLLYNGEHVLAVTPVLMCTFFLCTWAVLRNRLLSDPEDRVLRSVVLACVLRRRVNDGDHGQGWRIFAILVRVACCSRSQRVALRHPRSNHDERLCRGRGGDSVSATITGDHLTSGRGGRLGVGIAMRCRASERRLKPQSFAS